MTHPLMGRRRRILDCGYSGYSGYSNSGRNGAIRLGLSLLMSALLLPSAGSAKSAGSKTSHAPLVLRDMSGGQHDVDRLLAQGKNVTLLFWQTWCTSCKREAPHVVEAEKANADSIAFFGVIAGPDGAVNETRVHETVSNWGFRFPQIRDRDLELVHRYRAFGTPVIVILGPERRVLYRGYRLPRDWSAYRGRAAGAEPGANTRSSG